MTAIKMNRDIWQDIFQYESRDLVARQLERKHGKPSRSAAAREISCSFAQAREYFGNAARADRSVKPLLLYYGVLNLSRGAVLFLKPGISERALKPGHGLETVAWPETLKGGPHHIHSLQVTVRKGIFSYLVEATNNRTYLHMNTASVCASQDLDFNFDEDDKISLDDVLARIPDLHKEYYRWKEEIPPWRYVDIKVVDEDGIHLELRKGRGVYSADLIGEIIGGRFDVIGENEQTIRIKVPRGELVVFSETTMSAWALWQQCVVAPFPRKKALSDIAMCFMAAYFLGMLVRYYPSQWMGLIRNEKGDAIYPLLMRLLQYIEENYPRLILEYLEKWPATQ